MESKNATIFRTSCVIGNRESSRPGRDSDVSRALVEGQSRRALEQLTAHKASTRCRSMPGAIPSPPKAGRRRRQVIAQPCPTGDRARHLPADNSVEKSKL